MCRVSAKQSEQMGVRRGYKIHRGDGGYTLAAAKPTPRKTQRSPTEMRNVTKFPYSLPRHCHENKVGPIDFVCGSIITATFKNVCLWKI